MFRFSCCGRGDLPPRGRSTKKPAPRFAAGRWFLFCLPVGSAYFFICSNACSKSAIRSLTSSQPTEKRSRLP